MYCKECGKEIPENSKFCQHCGCRQSSNDNVQANKDVCTFPSDSGQSNQNIIINFLSKNKKYTSIYTLWLIINIILFCFGEEYVENYLNLYCKNFFFPFTYTSEYFYQTKMFDARFYDVTELLFYCILFPLVLYFSITLIKKWKNKQK